MPTHHGQPCWYELMTDPGALGAAEAFYGKVLGWHFEDAGMEGFTYHLARSGDDLVAGAMEPPPGAHGMSAFWLIYYAVDDADKAATATEAAGGRVYRAPADIPGTGRFAVLGDPQGAGFGVLAPVPMEGEDSGGAFNPTKPGHGGWNELMTTEPENALGFYSGLFGWRKSRDIDMGEAGPYRIFSVGDVEIGGVMGLGDAPTPAWLPYFSVESVTAAIERVNAAGGKITYGPISVTGVLFIAVGQDPQGAWFALAGPEGAP